MKKLLVFLCCLPLVCSAQNPRAVGSNGGYGTNLNLMGTTTFSNTVPLTVLQILSSNQASLVLRAIGDTNANGKVIRYSDAKGEAFSVTSGGIVIASNVIDSLNVRFYGAKGDGATDDTSALQNAINALTANRVLVVPEGTYKFSNLTFDPPDLCGIVCYGTLRCSSTSGTALTIGGASNKRFMIRGLAVDTPSSGTWVNAQTGVELRNLFNSTIELRFVYGFGTNVLCLGDPGGFAYNEIYIGHLRDGYRNLVLNYANSGFANANNFWGGRIDWSSDFPDLAPCIGVYANTNCNNNQFWGPVFEGNGLSTGTNGFSMKIDGQFNSVHRARNEAVGPILFGASSAANYASEGYWTPWGVSDLGSQNTVYSVALAYLKNTAVKLDSVTTLTDTSGGKSGALTISSAAASTDSIQLRSMDRIFYDGYEHIFRDQGGSALNVKIDSVGNLGVGTLSPVSKLDVGGDIRASTSITATNFFMLPTNYAAANFTPASGMVKIVCSNNVIYAVSAVKTNVIANLQ